MLKVVADQNIPLLDYFFSDVAQVVTLPASQFSPEEIDGADVVLVRSTVKVDAQLFAQHRPRWVGSCVSGQDHLDLAWLDQQAIPFYCATGCNAPAVSAYVAQAATHLRAAGKLADAAKIAVIGVGHVGRLVAAQFESLGYQVQHCDPLRAAVDPTFPHVDLADLFDCDMLCLHTPLTQSGAYPTQHMIDADYVAQLKSGAIILNAGRGAVLTPDALMREDLVYCLDVWPIEPAVESDWLQHCFLATPHIAGHTWLGKFQGTAWVYQALAGEFGWPIKTLPTAFQANEHQDLLALTADFKQGVLAAGISSGEFFQISRRQYNALEDF